MSKSMLHENESANGIRLVSDGSHFNQNTDSLGVLFLGVLSLLLLIALLREHSRTHALFAQIERLSRR